MTQQKKNPLRCSRMGFVVLSGMRGCATRGQVGGCRIFAPFATEPVEELAGIECAEELVHMALEEGAELDPGPPMPGALVVAIVCGVSVVPERVLYLIEPREFFAVLAEELDGVP